MGNILVVDDNINWLIQIQQILTEITQREILGFLDGVSLIESYTQLYNQKIQVDLIIIDCFMEKIDGLKEIIKINSEVPVIMMTGRHKKNIIDGVKFGAKNFIWKPFTMENVYYTLSEFISIP